MEDSYELDMVGAVRAELGRQRKSLYELTGPLGLSYPTISSRLNGHTSFTLDELRKVAAFLGITTVDLAESAELARKWRQSPSTEPAPPPPDPWEQPARARAHNRRSRAY